MLDGYSRPDEQSAPVETAMSGGSEVEISCRGDEGFVRS